MTWIRILGPLEICGGHEVRPEAPVVTVPVTSARLRRLLAALVARRGEVASSDWLADAVWGDASPANLDGALQTLVSRLRGLLRQANQAVAGDEVVELLTQPPGYRLDLGLAQLDAARFAELALTSASMSGTDPTEALAITDEALALWRGPAYAEFADEDFARPEAARLDELQSRLVVDRLELLLNLGRLAEATTGLEGVVASHPVDERPHALLMVARYRDGRQGDALDVFAQFRRRLADDLGLEPSAALQQVHLQILRQDPSLDQAEPNASSLEQAEQTSLPPGADDIAAGPDPHQHDRQRPAGNLPPERTPLVGRDDEVANASAAVAAKTVLTLTGPGGVGKTSLARSIGISLAGNFPDGVWWCELAAVAEPDAVANAIRTTLAAPPRPGETVLDRLVDYLSARRLLLILDNCEHVVDAAAELAERIQAECAGVAILATSRMPLDVTGEQVWPVSPLAAPARGEDDVDAIAREPAVRLFVTRATAHDPAFALAPDNARDIAEICRRLDGLPLALELAAARMRSMAPADLVDRLSWRFRLLHGGARTADARHRTLHALVDWSYELLEAEERQLFHLLSAFSGAFTLDDAEELAERVRNVPGRMVRDSSVDAGEGVVSGRLLDLVDRSMVSIVRAGDIRYQLLETVRAYGREKLAEQGDADRVAHAHAEQYADLADAAIAHAYTPLHIAIVDELASHIDELRAAFTWAIDHDVGLAVRIVGGLAPYVESRMSAEAGHWALRALGLCEEQGRTPAGLGRVYAVAASAARFASAIDASTRLLDAGRSVASDPLTRIYLVYLSSELALFEGRFDDGWTFLNEARAIASADDIGAFVSMGGVVEALLLAYSGAADEAIATADHFRRKTDADHNSELSAWAAYTQGEVRLDTDPERAIALLDEALVLARRVGDRYLTGVALVSAASVRSRHGDPGEALRMFRSVVMHWRDSGNWLHQWTTLRNVVDLLVRLGRNRDAAVLVGAMTTRASSIEPFGDEARRFDEASVELTHHLPHDELQRLRERGAALRDEEVVAFVLAALARSPQVSPTEPASSAMQLVEAPEAEVVDRQHRDP